ncbi:hypothetical protein LTR91_006017 [Friedmanniomyces endolithicus]|uniref:Nucleolar pre-ribosomal-associated protein 1 C-terminal domain-containing protein n=1 Tax=Friedmanniomyces endolithicus TaxID=329885 RepID=A0A4U0ULQ7_9PEZI|nr:hypothetical protein LTS09_006157 [Friedmanniomyces endolithicus]KAK0277390.1 hypothetical protein LTR35_009791 [Friedmanniomyces endolithicus]KAK0283121.1 hypothetical protein LTS00_011724 [Friedmanniomyces endolithicus]KAK0311143.1 hypothetical protein LTR01_003136 [Friedmanniomyces endolithicus]KAK0320127.1 hypothetical protein LTR82_009064 [Friedmanniomyces endolithicus]
MSKRQREQEDGSRPPKRPKPEQSHGQSQNQQYAPVVEDIQFARQLQQLLVFRQDGIQQLRHGLASFKAFLESILYHRDEASRPRQLSILREYLDGQKPAGELRDPEKPFLAQLWQAWSFGSQNDNDYLSSQVCATLALLLRTLSSLLDLRDHGILLGQTVLQYQHLRLVRRGLDAPNNMDYVVSPCLRLLTEVTSFDGGALAKQVYKHREQTFDINSLRRNLGLVRKAASDEEAKRRPSVRTLTVRYVLAHLKYLHEGGKIDLLSVRPLCTSLLQHLGHDPHDVVNEILSVTEQNVLRDNEMPRLAKANLLTQQNLERVTEIATRSGDEHPSSDRAYAWLKAVCTISSYGILRASGWYPPGTTSADLQPGENDSGIDLGLDSLDFYDRTERSEFLNTILHGWLQTLRPQTDPKERELAIMCFEAAPELVASYFAEKHFSLEPKLSNTWIGYASFIFEVIRLPVPAHLGNSEATTFAEFPPQTSIILNNLLPQPLAQKILTRCLNQPSELITFFAIRNLVLAFQKMVKVLAEMRRATASVSVENKILWQGAAARLLARFTQRTPSMQDVVLAFRRLPDDDGHIVQREAVTRLLRLYYEVTPVQALEAQVDVSTALAAALTRSEEDAGVSDVAALRALELEHLLVVAQHSAGMRWFTKSGGLLYSPVVSLLRLHTKDLQNRRIRVLLGRILEQHGLLVGRSGADTLSRKTLGLSELEALVASLVDVPGEDGETWAFVDDCMARATRQPVKYADQIDAAIAQTHDVGSNDAPLGLLAMVMAEQTRFVAENTRIIHRVAKYLGLLCSVERPSKAVIALHEAMTGLVDRATMGADDRDALLVKTRLIEPPTMAPPGKYLMEKTSIPFNPPPAESDDHPEIVRWSLKDLATALEDKDIDALILCLSSQHPDIRRQALVQLRHLFAKLQAFAIDDKGPLSVLIGSLSETFEQQCLHAGEDKPLPFLTATFAVRALHVLMEPAHFMYPKLNRFIMRSPEWRITRLPAYWLSNTTLSQPEEDDGYWKEVLWVLEWLIDGLRTSVDLDILRRGDVFAKMMALYLSPGAEKMKVLRERVLELVFMGTCVEGGSDVLALRTGVLGWLAMVGGDVAGLVRDRALRLCDGEKLVKWSGVNVEEL